MVSRDDGRARAERVIEVARATTERRLVTRVIEDGDRTAVVVGIVEDDLAEATRVHEAILEACERECLHVDVIVVANAGDD